MLIRLTTFVRLWQHCYVRWLHFHLANDSHVSHWLHRTRKMAKFHHCPSIFSIHWWRLCATVVVHHRHHRHHRHHHGTTTVDHSTTEIIVVSARKIMIHSIKHVIIFVWHWHWSVFVRFHLRCLKGISFFLIIFLTNLVIKPFEL